MDVSLKRIINGQVFSPPNIERRVGRRQHRFGLQIARETGFEKNLYNAWEELTKPSPVQLAHQARRKYELNRNRIMKQIYSKDNNNCYLCNIELKWEEVSLDHLLPICKYPELALDIDNIKICCKKCNGNKSDSLLN